MVDNGGGGATDLGLVRDGVQRKFMDVPLCTVPSSVITTNDRKPYISSEDA